MQQACSRNQGPKVSSFLLRLGHVTRVVTPASAAQTDTGEATRRTIKSKAHCIAVNTSILFWGDSAFDARPIRQSHDDTLEYRDQ